MKEIYTPDLYVRLRHGGTLQLSVCREDKVEILKALVHSLALNHSGIQLAQNLISEVERAPKHGGVWGNVTRLVKSPNCHFCGSETNFGGKGKFSLCKPHNKWRTYIKLRCGRWAISWFTASTGWPRLMIDTVAKSVANWQLVLSGRSRKVTT